MDTRVPGDGGFCIDLDPVQEEGVVILLVPVWYGTQFEVWCLVATELQQLKVSSYLCSKSTGHLFEKQGIFLWLHRALQSAQSPAQNPSQMIKQCPINDYSMLTGWECLSVNPKQCRKVKFECQP